MDEDSPLGWLPPFALRGVAIGITLALWPVFAAATVVDWLVDLELLDL